MATPFYPHIDSYLLTVAPNADKFNCTELKLVAGHPPLWQCNGEYSPIWADAEPLTPEQLEELSRSFLSNQELDDLAAGKAQAAYTNDAGSFTITVVNTETGLDISVPIDAGAAAPPTPTEEPAAEKEEEEETPPKIEVTAVADDRDQTHHAFNPVLEDYLKYAVDQDCSDVHFSTGSLPMWRRYGRLEPIYPNSDRLTGEQVKILCEQFLGPREWADLEKSGDADYAHATDFARFRASVVRQRLGLEIVMRIINAQIRTMEEINLPIKYIKPMARYQNGLILITGAVGSGKSTTMSAIMDFINKDRDDHILTMEDPIEFVFDPIGCHVTQREVHLHTESFPRALRGALRQDPDIILVGEMRALDTISLGLTAAETGHLVMGTLHTSSAPRTLDRILDVFPLDQRAQIRIMVSESLRGVICQQLLPHKSGKGRVMAMEMLVNNPAVGACIRDGKTFMLPGVMQTGKNVGMVTMDDNLQQHYIDGTIFDVDCYRRCEDKATMKTFLASHGVDPKQFA